MLNSLMLVFMYVAVVLEDIAESVDTIAFVVPKYATIAQIGVQISWLINNTRTLRTAQVKARYSMVVISKS